jgi:hypothetical protein
MDEQSQRTLTRRVVLGIFIAGLLVLSYQVLQFFLVPVAWAGILAFVTWPLHARLVRAAPSLPNLTALAMTVALAAAFVVPVVWLVVVIKTDFWAPSRNCACPISFGPSRGWEINSRVCSIAWPATAKRCAIRCWCG